MAGPKDPLTCGKFFRPCGVLPPLKKGKENIIPDAFLRRYPLVTQLDYKIFGLETIKDQYVHDVNFNDVLLHCKDGNFLKQIHSR
jgi:hypothetical protein